MVPRESHRNDELPEESQDMDRACRDCPTSGPGLILPDHPKRYCRQNGQCKIENRSQEYALQKRARARMKNCARKVQQCCQDCARENVASETSIVCGPFPLSPASEPLHPSGVGVQRGRVVAGEQERVHSGIVAQKMDSCSKSHSANS
jgi:hypothetical protein